MDERLEKLKAKIREGSVVDMESFLGYQISADILEEGIDEHIEKAYQQMSEEEILAFEKYYEIGENI